MSVIVPIYNEARYVERVLRGIQATPYDLEVITVDDGSTDGTSQILARLREELACVVLTHPKNLGKGRALRTGIEASTGSILLIQDADFEYDPSHYPQLLEPLFAGEARVVYGSRFLGSYRSISVWHRLGNRLITALVNLFFRASLTDVETGYKVFHRDLISRIPLRAMGFEFEPEVTCKLLRAGYRIFEVPISYHGRTYAEGKKVTWKDGLRALWVILCCRLNPNY